MKEHSGLSFEKSDVPEPHPEKSKPNSTNPDLICVKKRTDKTTDLQQKNNSHL